MLKPTGTKQLLGRRRSPPVGDINLARDDGPLGHDKPWCNDVANDRACRSNVELLPGYHVSRHRTANRDVLCEQVRCNRAARSDGQAMVAEFNRPLHVAINRQILSADDLALDSDRSSNPPSQSAFMKRCARIRRKPWSHSFARAIPVPHPVSPFRVSAGHRRIVDSTGLLLPCEQAITPRTRALNVGLDGLAAGGEGYTTRSTHHAVMRPLTSGTSVHGNAQTDMVLALGPLARDLLHGA